MKLDLEVVPSSSSLTDDDHNLNILLDAFGSAVSLDDIASSYCEAGRNLELTAEMLSNLQSSISGTQLDSQTTDGASSGCSSTGLLDKGRIAKLNTKKCPASMGTVSGLIGKDYINPRPQSKGLKERLKPMKINSNDFPVTEIWGEEKESGVTSQDQPIDNDLGEFLYKMLGNGFQLDRAVIQQVIGQCGYDMPTSIDKLLDISAATLEMSDDVTGIAAANNINSIHDAGSISCPKQSQPLSGSDASGGDRPKLPQTDIRRKGKEKEILEALFSASDKFQDHHECIHPVRRHYKSPYGQIVTNPMEEKTVEDFTFITRQSTNIIINEANEESYDELRKAVMENRVLMKEYYKASGDAFVKKEFESAQTLLAQGDFYKRKAQEADEKSAKILTENSNEDEEYCINMHFLSPKDALHHMRLHLTSLCAIQCMKVVVGTGGDKKDKRRKLLITKLLEEEGVSWTEEGNGWTISIRVDEIDHNNLSFINK